MKKFNIHLVFGLLLAILSINHLYSQPPDTLWTRSIGGEGSQSALAVFPTDDGGFIIGGSITNSGLSDFYLLKTDEDGELIWDLSFGEVDRYEALTCMIKTTDGGYLMAGKRAEDFPYSSYTDIFLIKTDANGSFLWSSIIGEEQESETPASVAQTIDEGYILCGSLWVNSQTVHDVFLRKTNSLGMLEWTEFINFEDGKSDNGHWIEVASDGGYLVTGKTQAFTTNYDDDAFILKTNSAGIVEWLQMHGTAWPYYEAGNMLLKTSDGGLLICGYRNDDGLDNNWYVVKTDANGNEIWHHIIGGIYHDKAFDACETSDGSYVVTGTYYIDNWHCFVVKYNSEGDTLWTKMWGDAGHSLHNYDIKQLDDGGYITVGTTISTGENPDIYLSRLVPDIVGVETPDKHSEKIPIKLNGMLPNPFDNATVISYEVFSSRQIEIAIYDITGNKMTTVVDEMKNPGIYEVHFIEYIPAGVYFCKLQSGSLIEVKKLIRTK